VTRLLHLTTPPLHGADVHRVQLELRNHGYPPGPIDGVYGAATAAAVRRFQRHAGLNVDGVVGARTQSELAKSSPPSPPAAHMGRAPAGDDALGWMVKRLGMREQPANSNRCPITQEFGLVGPWCMMAVSLAFKHGAGLILGEQTPHPWAFWTGRGFAYVPAFEAWAKSRGYWQGRTTPRRGDVACYLFGHNEPVHVGIVERYVGGGQFDALEGNTGLGNDSNGGELMRRRRYVSQVSGFARVSRRQP
jgi:peptidoglycan hydrolase-like protein with peptidoglycan-binding domain